MDKLMTYGELLQKLLQDYCCLLNAQPTPGVEAHCVFDTKRNQYLLVEWGWAGKKRVRRVVLYVCLVEGKFWIEEDWTEEGIATELLQAGVPRSNIVLAFQHPSLRDEPEKIAA